MTTIETDYHVLTDLQPLCRRGQVDFWARKQMLTAHKTKQRRIVIPRVPGSLAFWSWYLARASILRPGTPEIELVLSAQRSGPYQLTKPCVVAYSGGAESTLISLRHPQADLFHVADLGSKNPMYANPLEGGFAIIGAGLGYRVTFYGAERAVGEHLLPKANEEDEEDAVGNLFETEDEFGQRWKEYAGAEFVSPVADMDKLQIIKALTQEGVEFCSCIHSGTHRRWCGHCSKCIEAYYLHLMLGERPPFLRWKQRRPTRNTKNQT